MKDARIIVIVFAATLVITLVTALIAPQEGPGADAPTSFSTAPAGGKAAFLTLRALGYEVERSLEPVAQLHAEPADSVWVMTGILPPSEQDKRAFQAFVASGGVALVTGVSGTSFLGLKNEDESPSAFRTPPATHRVLTPSPITSGVTELTISALEASLTFGPEYVHLFSQTAEQPLVTTAAVGRGRVVWLSDPMPFMNEHIGKADNLRLLLNVASVAGVRRVLWDEHYHGNTRSLWSYAVNTPLPWMAAQAGLIVACAVFAFGRRRSPIRPRREVPRTSPLEFVDMLAALYRRSNAGGAAVASARTRFLRAVTTVCGVNPDRGDAEIARAAAAKLGIDPQAVLATLASSARAGVVPSLDQKAAQALARELQSLTSQLHALRGIPRPASGPAEAIGPAEAGPHRSISPE